MVVDAVSTISKTISNKYTYAPELQKLDLNQHGDDFIKIYDGDKEIEIEDLKQGDILRVVKSDTRGRRYIKAYLSREVIDGEAAFIENDEYKVRIGDAEYSYSGSYIAALEKNDSKAKRILIGTKYKFYLDSAGKIAYVTEMAGMDEYALVYSAFVDDFGETYILKLFKTDGEWKEIKLLDKITFNGVKTSVKDVIDELKTVKNGSPEIVKYTLNKDGKITSLTQAVAYMDGGNDGYFNKKDFSNIVYWAGSRSFDNEIFLSNNCVTFIANEYELTDKGQYYVGSGSEFADDNYYDVTCYDIDEFGFANIFFVKMSEDNAKRKADSESLMLVGGMGETLGPDDEIMYMAEGMMGAFESIQLMSEDKEKFENIGMGDTISVSLHKDGSVAYAKKYVSAENLEPVDVSNFHASSTFVGGVLKKADISGNRIQLDCGGKIRTIKVNSSISVMVYDTERKVLSRGTLADVTDSKYVGVKLSWSSVQGIVVYV